MAKSITMISFLILNLLESYCSFLKIVGIVYEKFALQIIRAPKNFSVPFIAAFRKKIGIFQLVIEIWLIFVSKTKSNSFILHMQCWNNCAKWFLPASKVVTLYKILETVYIQVFIMEIGSHWSLGNMDQCSTIVNVPICGVDAYFILNPRIVERPLEPMYP